MPGSHRRLDQTRERGRRPAVSCLLYPLLSLRVLSSLVYIFSLPNLSHSLFFFLWFFSLIFHFMELKLILLILLSKKFHFSCLRHISIPSIMTYCSYKIDILKYIFISILTVVIKNKICF